MTFQLPWSIPLSLQLQIQDKQVFHSSSVHLQVVQIAKVPQSSSPSLDLCLRNLIQSRMCFCGLVYFMKKNKWHKCTFSDIAGFHKLLLAFISIFKIQNFHFEIIDTVLQEVALILALNTAATLESFLNV